MCACARRPGRERVRVRRARGRTLFLYIIFSQYIIHATPPRAPAGQGESVFEYDVRVAERTLVMPPFPDDRMLCSFAHIFAGGYSAGYYSYK